MNNSVLFFKNIGGYVEKFDAYYRLNDNLNDEKTLYNGIGTNISYASGKTTTCAVFNGTAYVTGLPNIIYNDFSVSFWIKSSTTANLLIFSSRNTLSSPTVIEIAFNTNKIFSRIRSTTGSGDTALYTTTNLNNNNWHHFVMTFNKSTGAQKNYVNGVYNGGVTYVGGSFGPFNRTTLGVDALGLSYGKLIGSIDSVGLFSKELSASEVLEIYNINNAGTELL